MLFILALLAGFCHAQLDPTCLQGEFEVNGRYTGQNIDMDYDASTLTIDGSDTKLTLQFTVPKRYTEQHEGNAFAITFHRKHTSTFDAGQDWGDKVTTTVEAEADTVDTACYSNRYTNKTCSVGKNTDWTIVDSTENPTCVAFASVTVDWADVMKDTGALFGEVEVKDNGNNKEVFLTATVETWTHFREGDVGDDYLGVQTGNEQLTNAGENSNNRKGVYSGDGGDKDIDFKLDRVIIDDERYTLYQIPFVLRFPKTVIVTETFDIVTDIVILTAVSTQDVISLNLNPVGDETFGVLELTFTTEVQYPFGVIGPQQAVNGMKAYIGNTVAGGGSHAASIEFVEYDDAGVCRGLKESEVCRQNFKVRITPDNGGDPCSVAGQYTFEFWTECTAANDDEIQGCPIDDLQEDADDTLRRTSNAYGSQTINVAHQDFCPTLMDEIRVTGDFHVFHDEKFEEKILTGTSSNVYTNDILFFEATYRTTSLEDPITDFDTEGEGGGDSLIDYVRAQKIFLDVTIGDDREGNDLAGWKSDWEENFRHTLGGERIPGVSPGMDTAGGLTVTTGKDDGESKAVYNIVLCEVAYITPDVVQSGPNKPDDCFTAPKDIAVDYLDFNKVTLSKGTLNTIDENEVAFKLRLDERIIPITPPLDFSYLFATIQAEIYYKGNLHPSRRLLQQEPGQLAPGVRAQGHVMTTAFDVRRRNELEKCMVDNAQAEGFMQLQLTYANTALIPKVSKSPDFATTLQMQLESFLGVRKQITVSSIAVGGKAIYSKGRGGDRRRLAVDDNIVTVNIAVSSGPSKAGKVMNLLQDELMAPRSRINVQVTAFAQSTVSKMQVRGCRDEDNKKDDKTTSESTDLVTEESVDSPASEDEVLRKDKLADDKLASGSPGLTALFALAAAALVALC